MRINTHLFATVYKSEPSTESTLPNAKRGSPQAIFKQAIDCGYMHVCNTHVCYGQTLFLFDCRLGSAFLVEALIPSSVYMCPYIFQFQGKQP